MFEVAKIILYFKTTNKTLNFYLNQQVFTPIMPIISFEMYKLAVFNPIFKTFCHSSIPNQPENPSTFFKKESPGWLPSGKSLPTERIGARCRESSVYRRERKNRYRTYRTSLLPKSARAPATKGDCKRVRQ